MVHEVESEAEKGISASQPAPANGADEEREQLETKEIPSNGHDVERVSSASSRKKGVLQRLWKVLTWSPKRCRWDPKNPPKFSMGLNLLFGFVSYSFHLLQCVRPAVFTFCYLCAVLVWCCKLV
jgi:hypothetical protein